MPEDILAKPVPITEPVQYEHPTKTIPKGWSRGSNAPYYRREYAIWIRSDIDRMIEQNGRLLYEYSTFCTAFGISKNTLYNKINQAIRYLVDQMDTEDKKYFRWDACVDIKRNRMGKGVTIAFKPELQVGTVMSPPAQQAHSMPEWRVDMEDWLESNSKIPFVKEGLNLNENDIAELKEQFALIKNVLPSIKASSIKLVKL